MIVNKETHKVQKEPKAAKFSVLLIDDDKSTHNLVINMLPNAIVKTAVDESSLLPILNQKNNKFDIIILDYKLGNQNGLGLVGDIKKRFPFTKILLLTAFGSKSLLVEALEYKLDGYMDKPIKKDVLNQKINKLIEVITDRRISNISFFNIISGIFFILSSRHPNFFLKKIHKR